MPRYSYLFLLYLRFFLCLRLEVANLFKIQQMKIWVNLQDWNHYRDTVPCKYAYVVLCNLRKSLLQLNFNHHNQTKNSFSIKALIRSLLLAQKALLNLPSTGWLAWSTADLPPSAWWPSAN